jgi:hypothetical protein
MNYLDPVIFSIGDKQISIRNADTVWVAKKPRVASWSIAAEHAAYFPVGTEPVYTMISEGRYHVAARVVAGDRHRGGCFTIGAGEIRARFIRVDADDSMVPRIRHKQYTAFQRDHRMGLIKAVQTAQQTPVGGQAENRSGDRIADQDVARRSDLTTGRAAKKIVSDRRSEYAVRREYVNAMIVQIGHVQIAGFVDGDRMGPAELIRAATRRRRRVCRRPAPRAAAKPAVKFQTGRQPHNSVARKFGDVDKPIAIDLDIERARERPEDRNPPAVAELFSPSIKAPARAKKIRSTAQAKKRFSHGDDCRISAGPVNQ